MYTDWGLRHSLRAFSFNKRQCEHIKLLRHKRDSKCIDNEDDANRSPVRPHETIMSVKAEESEEMAEGSCGECKKLMEICTTCNCAVKLKARNAH